MPHPKDRSATASSQRINKDVTSNSDAPEKDYILMGARMKAPSLHPALYIVATPIGNLKDITIRALETLASSDLIACEDTRISRKLLSHYDIRTRLITYHEHNAEKQRPILLDHLAQDKAVALISDAGTPLLSDPGYKLVEAVLEEGYDIVPVPGASALLSALVASGLPTDQVHFAGFLPQKAGARDAKLQGLTDIPGSLIFYESPRRLKNCLPAMASILGGQRQAVIARELTKKFEEFRRGSLDELADFYASSEAPKGEAVILLGPGGKKTLDSEDIDQLLRQGLTAGHHVKQLAAGIAEKTGKKKNEIYRRAQQIKDNEFNG